MKHFILTSIFVTGLTAAAVSQANTSADRVVYGNASPAAALVSAYERDLAVWNSPARVSTPTIADYGTFYARDLAVWTGERTVESSTNPQGNAANID